MANNSSCKELLQAILHNASEDQNTQVGTLLRSLYAQWETTDDGASIILPKDYGKKHEDLWSSDSTMESEHNAHEVIPLVCRRCSWIGPESKARAFVTDPSSIVFCQGRCEENLEMILVHELTHMYDIRLLQKNLRDCRDLAYSEIRAANFAECRGVDIDKTKCVKRHAIAATKTALQQHRQEHNAKACIDGVFDRAIRDKRPFNASKTQ